MPSDAVDASTLALALTVTPDARRTLAARSVANLARMGHCAPTVMQTLLDACGVEAPWLVKAAAGLPGGIGNTGDECGGVTAPLMLLGIRHGREPLRRGLPIVVDCGHDLIQRFTACHGSVLCRAIRGDDRLPLRCVSVVRQAGEGYCQTTDDDRANAIGAAQREEFARLYAHFSDRGFHCAHAVLEALRPTIVVDRALLDATSGFVGGTVFAGRTCSAFTAGVIALGVARGEIEQSRLRVLGMISLMALGGDAFADDRNAFNKSLVSRICG
jgi:C_GCAxxG_C_C family probable redox protein